MTTRELLTDITGVGDRDKLVRWNVRERFDVEVRPLLEGLVEILESPPGPEFQFNCYAYALNLRSISNSRQFKDGFVYASLVEKLINEGHLPEVPEPTADDIVLYWNDGVLKHAAKYEDAESVVSKWSGGPLLRHALWDVPTGYGGQITYHSPLSEVDAKQLFLKYEYLNRP